VWASLGPIEAQSAILAARRTQRGRRDPELGEKTGACSRDLSDVLVEDDVVAGDESVRSTLRRPARWSWQIRAAFSARA
jgi:hypothetical protein